MVIGGVTQWICIDAEIINPTPSLGFALKKQLAVFSCSLLLPTLFSRSASSLFLSTYVHVCVHLCVCLLGMFVGKHISWAPYVTKQCAYIIQIFQTWTLKDHLRWLNYVSPDSANLAAVKEYYFGQSYWNM